MVAPGGFEGAVLALDSRTELQMMRNRQKVKKSDNRPLMDKAIEGIEPYAEFPAPWD